MKLKFLCLTILLLLNFSMQAAHAAKEIRLFPKVQAGVASSEQLPVDDYDAILANFEAGDTLLFDDGAAFEFIENIGSGLTTRVIKVRMKDGPLRNQICALRIPIRRSTLVEAEGWNLEELRASRVRISESALKVTYSLYIDDIIKHAQAFAQTEIGPQLYSSYPGQYAAVELIDRKFALDQFLRGEITLDTEQQIFVEQALYKFVRKSAGVLDIKDIRQPEQMLFDGKRFVLIDWFEVKFVDDRTDAKLFYEWQSMVESIIEPIIHDLKYATQNQLVRNQLAFLKRVREGVKESWKAGRIDLLQQKINPFTGRQVPSGHTWYDRNFGSWSKAYRDLAARQRSAVCEKSLEGSAFD